MNYTVKILVLTVELEVTMEFTEKELEQIRYALKYFHDRDLIDLETEEIRNMESAMGKLGMKFHSQLPSEFDGDGCPIGCPGKDDYPDCYCGRIAL